MNTRINKQGGSKRQTRQEASKRLILWTATGIYTYMLVKIILFKFQTINYDFLLGRIQAGLQQPGLLSQRLQSGNLIPFREITNSLHYYSDHAMFNLVGNVAIFIPFGLLLGLMFHNGMRVVICAFFLSLGLETTQLLLMIGQFDVDDILLNTIGGFLGFLFYRIIISPFLNRKRPSHEKR